MKNGELSETVRASEQCHGVAGVCEEAQGKACIWSLMSRSQAAAFSSALFVFTGLSVSTPRLFCLVGPAVVLRLSDPYLSSDCPAFFFSLPRIHRAKYNLSFLLGQSLALWQTVVLNYIGIRDIGGVSHCFNLLWLWSNECNANRM